MMKRFFAACALAAVLPAAAEAADASIFALFADKADQGTVQEAYWIGRYGQPCDHGPVWLPECHASDTPGVWIPGHWNPMHTEWIPGHYF